MGFRIPGRRRRKNPDNQPAVPTLRRCQKKTRASRNRLGPTAGCPRPRKEGGQVSPGSSGGPAGGGPPSPSPPPAKGGEPRTKDIPLRYRKDAEKIHGRKYLKPARNRNENISRSASPSGKAPRRADRGVPMMKSPDKKMAAMHWFLPGPDAANDPPEMRLDSRQYIVAPSEDSSCFASAKNAWLDTPSVCVSRTRRTCSLPGR